MTTSGEAPRQAMGDGESQNQLPPLPEGYNHTRERDNIEEGLSDCALARRRYAHEPETMARLDVLEAGYRERLAIWEQRDLPYEPVVQDLDPRFEAYLTIARGELGLLPNDPDSYFNS